MGLIEKRLIERAKSDHIPAIERRIAGEIGLEVKVEIDWASFGENRSALEEIPSGLLTGFVVLRELCLDDFSKTIVQNAVRIFRLVNCENKEDAGGSFYDGIIEARLPNGGAASVSHAPKIMKSVAGRL